MWLQESHGLPHAILGTKLLLKKLSNESECLLLKHKPASSQPILFSIRGLSLPSPPLPWSPLPWPASSRDLPSHFPLSHLCPPGFCFSFTHQGAPLGKDEREDERGGKVLIKHQMFNFVN